MNSLENKIDFALIFNVKKANPNGDPLNGNRPRTDYDGFGEVTDVCLKRKIRDRLMESEHVIFVQGDYNVLDSHKNLKSRADSVIKDYSKPADVRDLACKTWFDVRAFGQIFPFKAKGKDKDAKGVSIAIRGPVTIQSAFSVEPITVSSNQIIKSTSLEGDGVNRQPDQMGMKHRVDRAIYVTFGSMNPQLSERTEFNNDDAETIKAVLPKLFEGDASSARPEGSMAVEKVIWWQHNSKSGQYSSAKVHRTLSVNQDGSFELDNLDGLKPEEIDGF
jgi:CRISPR-associated protein Csd2